ncbi:MAG: hypothetical protein R3Y16_06575 [Rikenellaceae bacterium]
MEPFTDIEEEIIDQDEQLSQQILRGVQQMEGRVDGEELIEEEEFDEAEESEDSQELETAEAAEEQGEKRENVLWPWISGNVLIGGLAKYYGQLIIIASIFLVSIIITFWSLHLDMEYSTLSRDVQLLRERSVRMKEMRFTRCSQSAIIEELERRGIELVNRTTPATVIEDKW